MYGTNLVNAPTMTMNELRTSWARCLPTAAA